MKLHEASAIVLFGKVTDETMYKVGELSVSIYTNSFIGKTMFALLGSDFKKIIMSAPKIYASATSGVDIQVTDLGENKAKLTIKNDPYPIAYNKGVYTTAAKNLGYDLQIEAFPDQFNNTDYLLEWKKLENKES